MSGKNYTEMWNLIQSENKLNRSDFFDNFFDYSKFKIAVWITDPVLLHLVDNSTELLESSSVPVYRYHFAWNGSPEPWRSIVGSYHGIDVSYVFGNFEMDAPSFTDFTWGKNGKEEREILHTKFANALRGFVESADPNKYDAQLGWSQWRSDKDDLILE